MLTHKFTLPLALSAMLFNGPFVSAQSAPRRTTTVETVPGATAATTIETTSTTTAAGVVSEMAPDRFVVRTATGIAPIRYWSSASTVYVDESGNPVARELMTPGVPVTVHFTRVGEGLVADRVVLQRQTTTTAAPTIIERNTTVTRPPVVVEKVIEKPIIVEKKIAVPVEKKVYVDRPVIVEKPVVVEKRVPAPAPPVLIEKKTTTTTTTKSKKDDD